MQSSTFKKKKKTFFLGGCSYLILSNAILIFLFINILGIIASARRSEADKTEPQDLSRRQDNYPAFDVDVEFNADTGNKPWLFFSLLSCFRFIFVFPPFASHVYATHNSL